MKLSFYFYKIKKVIKYSLFKENLTELLLIPLFLTFFIFLSIPIFIKFREDYKMIILFLISSISLNLLFFYLFVITPYIDNHFTITILTILSTYIIFFLFNAYLLINYEASEIKLEKSEKRDLIIKNILK